MSFKIYRQRIKFSNLRLRGKILIAVNIPLSLFLVLCIVIVTNAEAMTHWMRDVALLIGMFIFILGGLGAYFVSRSIAVPLQYICETIDRLAQGKKLVDCLGQKRGDEIGEICQALQVLNDVTLKKQALYDEELEELQALHRICR
ncbi:hypothetical protein QGN29_09945 [Temperatibacter marinus]|uniref:HAMP domain-containing protein n=1 Tax=Temperatibacter marinus TaxID=1456591 RepID=A0AA52EG24_9PROT|nr:hypothetical protein [Temperatibacter marinus]WND01872.1 hypothetical protein QGN29_09945 [Temperatibacter marinus]